MDPKRAPVLGEPTPGRREGGFWAVFQQRGGGGTTEVNEMQNLLVVYTKKTLNTSTRR